MINKHAIPGYRVAPMYSDLPNGTIIGRCADGLNVMVSWDDLEYADRRVLLDGYAKNVQKEQIKYLRKGV
jgi:hypothetical protein